MTHTGSEDTGVPHRGPPVLAGTPGRGFHVAGLVPLLSAMLLLVVTFGFAGTANAQTPVPTPSGPIVITVTPSTAALTCAGNANVVIRMTIGGLPAPDGSSITLSTNIGTMAPALVSTTGGNAASIFFAPISSSGAATLTATSGSTTGQGAISVFCGPGVPGPSVPGAALGQPVINCIGGSASVTFSWTPVPGADVQWVDLSLFNNGFSGDSFVGFGPLNGTTNQIQWNGLAAGQTHWWRVSAGVPGVGWAFSRTGAFTPCGTNPAPGTTTFACSGSGRAAVTFGIGQTPPGTTATWVDLSLFSNGFLPGSYVGANASSVTTSFVWTGILANAQHFWRVNNLTPQGWVTSQTGTFIATC